MKLVIVLICVTYLTEAFYDSHYDVSARFLSCSKPTTSCGDQCTHSKAAYKIINDDSTINQQLSEYRGPTLVDSCRKKIYLTIKLNNFGKVSGDADLILIDEVEDPETNNMTRLLHPIILRINRLQPQVIYPLKFSKVVNGGAYEDVLIPNDTRKVCDISSCAGRNYENEIAEGFCCTCDKSNTIVKSKRSKRKNSQRISKQITFSSSADCSNESEGTSYPPNFFFEHDKLLVKGKNGQSCPMKSSIKFESFGATEADEKSKKGEENGSWLKNNPDQKSAEQNSSHHKEHTKDDNPYYDYYDDDDSLPDYAISDSKNVRKSSGQQIKLRRKKNLKAGDGKLDETLRGRINKKRLESVLKQRQKFLNNYKKSVRQSCSGEKEIKTMHCLRYSDLWYSMYNILDPIVIQDIEVQMYQKRYSSDGQSYLVDLTRGNIVKLGTYFPQARDELPTISFSYSSSLNDGSDCDPDLCPIHPRDNFLLVPTHAKDSPILDEHAEAQGGPEEYLVISESDVTLDGKECDKVGSASPGFITQENPCGKEHGSCLKNQPVDLWLEDMEKKMQGERGKYLIENYGSVPSLLTPSANFIKGEFIVLDATGHFQSEIEIELRSDMNALLRKGWNLQIQSILSDSLQSDKTYIEVLVVNTGFTAGKFSPKLQECTTDLPDGCVPDGPVVNVSPLQRHLFGIYLEGVLPSVSMTCTVEIQNENGFRVASRQILIEKQSRCLCAFHCSCTCLTANREILECNYLMQEEYIAAGYLEKPSHRVLVHAELPIHLESFQIFLLVMTLQLLLGKLKMILGIRSRRIRKYGLEYIRGSTKCCLKEELPRKEEISWCTECLINTLFFILYPLKILWVCPINCCLKIFRIICARCRKTKSATVFA